MPMNDEMQDRSVRSKGAAAKRDATVVRAPRARSKTGAAALTENTQAIDMTTLIETDGPDGIVLAGRYELGVVLGRGATGVVLRGRDRVLGRDVAIKLLYADLARERETSARFQQEARIAARIHHPNAVAIFDTGVHDDQPFIVMECLPG